jgi:hypothetical protein
MSIYFLLAGDHRILSKDDYMLYIVSALRTTPQARSRKNPVMAASTTRYSLLFFFALS